MSVIDRRDEEQVDEETDLSRWHTAFIWWPRFVLSSATGSEPSWKFVWFGEILRRSIGSEMIAGRRIHRWVYLTRTVLAH